MGGDSLLLCGAKLAVGHAGDGRVADVRLAGGGIDAVGEPGSLPPADVRLDLEGWVLLPAPAEPHAHLDKALTGGRVANPGGDLVGAIDAWRAYAPTIGHDDLVRRGREAALMYLANGATAVRTHVDTGTTVGLRGLRALVEVRESLRGRVELSLVAGGGLPLTGADGAEHRALLRAAMEAGADAVGGCPHLDPDPVDCTEICLETAAEFGKPIDLHTDETLDPGKLYLPVLAELVARTGFSHGAAASHCTSLGVQPPEVAARVAKQVAEAGVAVICNPQTNLYLLARDHPSAPPRGLTAVRALLDAGATVAGGGDNLRDPFNPMGRADPLETASLLVTAGHLTPMEGYEAVSAGARAAMGLPEVRVEPGYPAELLAVRAGGLSDALTGDASRVVVHAGRVVSRTTVTREFPDR